MNRKAIEKMGLQFENLLKLSFENNGKMTRAFDYFIFWQQISNSSKETNEFLLILLDKLYTMMKDSYSVIKRMTKKSS